MAESTIRAQIKQLIVRELNLEGKDPASIQDEAPLFGEGLGLDSLDALQLAMSIEETFGVRIPEGDEARPIFRSVASLAEYILRNQGAQDGVPLAGGPSASFPSSAT
ncbi:phosphopantetheine-binding protein [Pendulispora rubella]|uniref:Phosphopantetheine-binding protein n=1 Tax=Pendulispora rubella TaxID=2741070 RepID=A0ABZ2LJD8_9BACT